MVKLKFNVAQSIVDTYDMENRKKNKPMNIAFNEDIFYKGHAWYYSGLKLEAADESLRNNKNFVNGYNRAARISKYEDNLFALGESFFKAGFMLEEIPESHRNNEIVLSGYENAKINHRKK